MSRYDFIGNFNLKVAAKSVDDVLRYLKSRVGNINSKVNVTYERVQVNRIEQDFKNVNKQIKKTSELTDDLASIFANATRRFAGVSIATATLLSLVRGVKGAYKEAIQFEREMIKVAQAQDATIESTKGLSREISRLSVNYGINALELAKTGRVLAQAGFNTKTTTKALEILAKINLAGTFGDAEENVEGMISVLQQFGAEARASGTEAQFLEEKFDIINKISKKYAVESSDIITAVSKAGGSFETAGGSLEDFIASITAVRSATRESAATIANGFKTIFTRLQRAETIDALRELGVELVSAEGKFVGPIEAMERLGRTLSVLDKGDVRFTQIAEEIGGIYQVNRLITLLKQQDVVQKALNDTKTASGDIDKDVEKRLQGTASKLERLSASFQDLIKTYSESSSLKQFVDLMITMGNTAIATAKALEPLLPLIGAAASLQGIILGGKITKKLFGFAKDPKSIPTIAANNLATGGIVRGGKGAIDDVPAMLTRGEFVINKRAAQKNKALLLSINSGQDAMFAAKGGGVGDDLPINTVTSQSLKSSKVSPSKLQKLVSDKIKSLTSKDSIAAQKLSNVIDPRKTRDVQHKIGEMDYTNKSMALNSNKYSPYVMDHELGHAVDRSGNPKNTISKDELPSRTPGTFNNTLVNASRGVAAKNAEASGMKDIKSSDGSSSLFEYRQTDQEIFAEVFANINTEGQKLLLKFSSVSTNVEEVAKSLSELDAAIDKGTVTFGTEINNNIKQSAKEYQVKAAKQQQIVSTNNKQSGVGASTPYYGPNSASYITGSSSKLVNPRGANISPIQNSSMSRSSNSNIKTFYDTNEEEDLKGGKKSFGTNTNSIAGNPNSAFNQINSLGSNATKEELDNSLNLYTKLIKKGMDPQRALNQSIEKLASDVSKRTNTKEDTSPNLLSPYYGPNTARDKRLEYMKNKGIPISSGGDSGNIPRSPNGPVGPIGPNGRGPIGPNGPNGPGNTPSGGPPNDPTKSVAVASNKLADILSRFGGSALLAAGGIAFMAESMGVLDSSFSNAAGSFAAGFGSVYLTLGTMTDSLSSFAQNMSTATTAAKASEIAQKANTVSEIQETVANQQATVSETMETAANQKSAASGLMGSMGKMGSGVSRAINGLSSLTLGLSVAAGLYSAINSLQSDYINKLKETNDKIIDRAREGKSQNGDDALLKKNIQLQGDAIGRNDKIGETVGTGGAIGTVIGGVIGSIFGPLGTVVGGVVGAIAGSGIGYAFNQLTGNTKSYIESLQIATESQYRAAQSSASFDRTLKTISTNQLTAAQATSRLDKALKDAEENLRKAQGDTARTNIKTSESSGIIDTIGTYFGAFDPDAKSSSQQKIFDQARAAEAAQKEVVVRAAEAKNTNIKDVSFEKINKSTNVQELESAIAFAESQADAIRKNTIAASTETDQKKKEKEGDDAARAFLSTVMKNSSARNDENSRINAAKEARELELEAIKKTTSTLLSLSDRTNNLNIASALFDQVTTGFSKSVSGSRFSDISNIKDIGAFEKDARSVGSNLGREGQDAASSVVLGAKVISELRDKLTSNTSEDFNKLRENGLNKETNAESIRQILIGKSGSFSKLSGDQQKSIVSNIQSKFGKEKFDVDTLDKVINDTASMFQRQADVLGKQADLTNEQVERIRATNQVLQEAYIKNAELQIGLVDVQKRGQDRLNKVFDAVLTGNDRNAIIDNEERARTQKANIALSNAGVGNIAGDTGALSNILQTSQARRSRNNQALEGESNMAVRSALNTDNQRLDAAIKATTDELNRLANQSEKASGVMAKIDREQSKRNFVANKAEAFITGGPQDRARAREQESAVNLAMMTGTLQNLPADLKKSTLDEIRERAKLDDTGQTQKYLDRILSNDARNPAERAALLNVPTTKEQQLINDLRGIAAAETKAQQALISSQTINTKTMTDLLSKVNVLLGQPLQNVPRQPLTPGQQPQGQRQNIPVNPAVNIGGPRQFAQTPQLNGGMNTVADNITKMTNAISGMKVDHQININGQINVGGLNLKNIEIQLAKGLEGYIVQKVTETIKNSEKGFKTG